MIAAAWPGSSTAGRSSVVPASGDLIISAAMIDVASLSAISGDFGEITGGIVQAGAMDPRFRLNFNATGSEDFLTARDSSNNIVVAIRADGTAEFGGVVTAQSFTGARPVFSQSLRIQGGQTGANPDRVALSANSQGKGQINVFSGSGGSASFIMMDDHLSINTNGTREIRLDNSVRIAQIGNKIGFFGATPIAKPTVM